MTQAPRGWFVRERVRLLVAQCIVDDKTVERSATRLAELDREERLSAYGLRMLAGLELHAGEPRAARELLERAIEQRADDDDPRDRQIDRLLAAAALLEEGDAPAGLERLDALAREDLEETGLGASVQHTRGVALEAAGDIEAALAAYRASLEQAEDYDQPHVRLDVARLLAQQGDRAAAVTTLEESERDESYGSAWGETAYSLARLHAAEGCDQDAIAAIERAVSAARDASVMRQRAREDEAFAALRGLVAFALATSEPVVDPRWLAAYPALGALSASAELGELGVRFVAEADGREGGDALREHYAGTLHLGTLWVESLWKACQEVAAPLTLIAEGPAIPGARHAGELKHRVRLYADLNAPEHVWIAPSAEFPAALFTRVPADAAAIARAIRVLFLEVPASVRELTGVRRAFMGHMRELAVPNPYSGELEEAGPHELERHFNFSPAADPLTWGGAYDDDPWPDIMPAVQSFKLVALSRERRAQRRGSVARITRRTQHSRSHLGYEIHQAGSFPIYVWHVRYRPNPYPDTIARYNEASGQRFPTDLPADVVAAIIGFDWMPAEQLVEMADGDDPDQAIAALEVLAAIEHLELATTERLRRWAAQSDAQPRHRARVAQLCLDYNWRALLEELTLAETDEELRGKLLSVLRNGIGEPTFNEMGEPANLYDGAGDDDDYEDEDYEEDDA